MRLSLFLTEVVRLGLMPKLLMELMTSSLEFEPRIEYSGSES